LIESDADVSASSLEFRYLFPIAMVGSPTVLIAVEKGGGRTVHGGIGWAGSAEGADGVAGAGT